MVKSCILLLPCLCHIFYKSPVYVAFFTNPMVMSCFLQSPVYVMIITNPMVRNRGPILERFYLYKVSVIEEIYLEPHFCIMASWPGLK